MSIISKLLRRKQDPLAGKPSYGQASNDDLGLPELDHSPLPRPGEENPESFEPSLSPLRINTPQQILQPQGQQSQMPLSHRDVELILSKLDAIRSVLTNLDMRIANLEKIAGVSEEKEQKGYRW